MASLSLSFFDCLCRSRSTAWRNLFQIIFRLRQKLARNNKDKMTNLIRVLCTVCGDKDGDNIDTQCSFLISLPLRKKDLIDSFPFEGCSAVLNFTYF